MDADKSVEYHVENVRAYEVGKPDSLVVVIPKTVRRMLNLKKGAKFLVKIDLHGRIIYEPELSSDSPAEKIQLQEKC